MAASSDSSEKGNRWRGHAVLLIPVPQLEPFVKARTSFYDASFVSDDPRFTHAHITLLAPLIRPPEPDAMDDLVSGMRAFDYRLDLYGIFLNHCIHLCPNPREPFDEMIAQAMAAFPEVEHFGGDRPEPHLTLDMAIGDVTMESTRQLVGDLVPAICRADRVELHWYEAGACQVLSSWQLPEA